MSKPSWTTVATLALMATLGGCGAAESSPCAAAALHVGDCLGEAVGPVPPQCDATAAQWVIGAPCSQVIAGAAMTPPWWCQPNAAWMPRCASAVGGTGAETPPPVSDPPPETPPQPTTPTAPAPTGAGSGPPAGVVEKVTNGPGVSATLRGIWRRGSEMWVVGDEGTARHTLNGGASWETPKLEVDHQPYTRSIRAATVIGGTTFLAGEGVLFDFGKMWDGTTTCAAWDFTAIWGTEHREGYDYWGIVLGPGLDGHSIVWQSGNATGTANSSAKPVLGGGLAGVWGASADDIWVVGDGGKVLNVAALSHGAYDETATLVADHSGQVASDLNAVSGAGSRNVWIVGDAGMVLNEQGGSWSTQQLAVFDSQYTTHHPDLHAVWADPSADAAWVVGDPAGDRATLLYVERLPNGALAKTQVSVPTTQPLFGITGSSSCDLWIVGGGGTFLHRRCN